MPLKPKWPPKLRRPLTVWLSGLAGTALAITLLAGPPTKSDAENVPLQMGVGIGADRSLAKEALLWHPPTSAVTAPPETTRVIHTSRASRVAPTTTLPPTPPSTTSNVDVESADKMFIYMKESGNNPASVNKGGCVGLGQNCPDKHGNVAVVAACPNWQNDYACQDAWFENYMRARYKTWHLAKVFWLQHHWW